MKTKRNNYLRGFTLIEVIVVVSLIGILSSIIYVNYNDARKSARDDIRKSSLKELQLSLELYKAQNGQYPVNNAGFCSTAANKWAGPGPQSGGDVRCDGDDYITGLTPDYIAKLPQDPNQEMDSGKGYLYKSDGDSYKVMVVDSVESKTVTDYSDEFARCPTQGGGCPDVDPPANTYAVYSHGAEDW